MKGITKRPAELDPWARAWCRCQAAGRRHAHVPPSGLALVFADQDDQRRARERRARRWAIAAVILAAGWAAYAIAMITTLGR